VLCVRGRDRVRKATECVVLGGNQLEKLKSAVVVEASEELCSRSSGP